MTQQQSWQQANQGYGQAPMNTQYPPQQGYTQQIPYQVVPISSSNRLIAFLLAFFLGFLGIHRFYVGKVGTGVLMILTAGGLGVWWLIDIIMILAGGFRDKAGLVVKNWS